MTDIDTIRRARQLTGEATMGRRQLPYIKFMGRASKHGEAGKYYMLRGSGDQLNATEIGTELTATIIRIMHTADNGQSQPRVYVREFGSYEQPVEVKVAGTDEVETFANYAEAKEKYADLSASDMVYVAYGRDICRMRIGGGSLKNFWNYLAGFGVDDTVLKYKTTFRSEEKTHSTGNYFAMTFERGEQEERFEQLMGKAQKMLPKGGQVETLDAPLSESDQNAVDNLPF